MRTFSFTRFMPTFGQTFSLILLVLVLFLLSWWISYTHTIDPDTVKRISCPTVWKEDNDAKKWLATSSCPFGEVKSSFSGTALFQIASNGRPNSMSCWNIEYPSGNTAECEFPK